MRKFLMLFFAFAIALSFGITNTLAADQNEDMDKMKAEAMAKWQEYATPSEGHKVMEQLVGNWDYSLKYWTSPHAPPEQSTGTNDIKWILGNRFLEMDVKGTSMGQPFQGMGIIGYDNAKKEYVNTWIDTMGTGMMNATGSYNAETKTMTEKGTFTDPMTGEQSFKGVTKFIDDNRFNYEMYISNPDGTEFRNMEINYTRKK
ncbi:MAG: DUF1579 domain-containing protein [Thermodesulfobacteriota bacterium]